MSKLKKPYPQAPQVGDYIKFKGKLYEVYHINPDDGTFLIDTGTKMPVELSGDDWIVY